MFKNPYIEETYNKFVTKNKGQNEYINACKEILESLELYVSKNNFIEKYNLLERFLEPERMISFKVVWEDDNHKFHVNRGYRVQYNSSIGPYKGGIRFHPSVNDCILCYF